MKGEDEDGDSGLETLALIARTAFKTCTLQELPDGDTARTDFIGLQIFSTCMRVSRPERALIYAIPFA